MYQDALGWGGSGGDCPRFKKFFSKNGSYMLGIVEIFLATEIFFSLGVLTRLWDVVNLEVKYSPHRWKSFTG